MIRLVLNIILINLGFCDQDCECLAQNIYTTYTAPERGYHNIKHISNRLTNLDKFLICFECVQKIKNINEFAFAILMHDYIHGTKNDINASIKKAKTFLHKISLQYNSDYIENLIKATDYEKCKKIDFDQQLIQDLDLNTLGASNTEYNKYANQIRLEYKQFSDDVFYQERIKILHMFLSREHIFNIKYFRDKYEHIARANITKEISKLKK